MSSARPVTGALGYCEGIAEGEEEGNEVGIFDGIAVGSIVGWGEGLGVGSREGEMVGFFVVGAIVGSEVVGAMVGVFVGDIVGAGVDLVGAAVGGGAFVGDAVEAVGVGVLRKLTKSGFVELMVSDVTGASVGIAVALAVWESTVCPRRRSCTSSSDRLCRIVVSPSLSNLFA